MVEAGPLGTLLTGDVVTGGHFFHDVQVPIFKIVFKMPWARWAFGQVFANY